MPPGSRVFIGSGAAVPFALVDSFLQASSALHDVELTHIHTLGEMPWLAKKYDDHLRTNTFFLTHNIHKAVAAGRADYTPCTLADVPSLFGGHLLPVDVALIQVSPPDEHGYVSLGVSVDVVRAAVKAARTVVAQINPSMPRQTGAASISAKKIHYFIEHDQSLPEIIWETPRDAQIKAAQYAALLIEDGSTIQAGLGNTPQAVLAALKNHRHLGIYSGIFTDPMMELIECGAVDNSRKQFQKGKVVCSTVLGSQKLYEFIHNNPDIEMQPSDWVGDVRRIARNTMMTAIHGAYEVDLTGQVVRDSRGHRFYGGMGSTQDFIRGAGHSKNGRPIIVLTSQSDDGKSSRIVSGFKPGSGVNTGRGDVHYVVTEYGIARLKGRSIRQRVLNLVEIAHPNHRERLLRDAHRWGWIPKFYNITPTEVSENATGVEARTITLSGKRFTFRPLHPSDTRALQSFFYSHTKETVNMRYGYLKDRLTDEAAYKLTSVNQSVDVAFALFTEMGQRQEICAVGRFYRDPTSDSAEVAFIVGENFRRLGIARFLLAELTAVALRRGIKTFWASVLKKNKPMAALFTSYGATKESHFGEDSDEFTLNTQQLADRLAQPPHD
ncbi:GNAT family N-acetyltransferase [Verrucomicrobiaceae bacterium 5K15]|uniref:GNAT family N-acetyltransferase n=1 Tax=Oceaniferula flava TaxID=2800421 RepID=A0AAE2V7C5_9BACT|nr:GNAT family N-acetyltransferase [Oceaniferula flavus]MBK1853482.1 GNAT family N-acetyltransferase [Oceaniferula flavus]MBM1134787.1 GNAT family N-acetyltransferase [Oceaniferula flavus]